MLIEIPHKPEHLEVGVDWVTLTLQAEREGYRDWAMDAMKWVEEGEKRGDIEKAVSLNGYSGYMCSGRFIGSRKHDTMLRVSGQDATWALWEYWRKDCNVSRLDLQITIWPKRHTPGSIIKRGYARAKERWTSSPRKAPEPRLFMDKRGSATVMIGSPKSRFMLRVYDKGGASQEDWYKGAVRYELQMRDELAREVAGNIVARGLRGMYMATRDTVIRECRKRDIDPLEGAADDYAVASSLKREQPDVERQLAWLQSQVAPTVRRLAALGKLSEVFLALGVWQFSEDDLKYALDRLREIE